MLIVKREDIIVFYIRETSSEEEVVTFIKSINPTACAVHYSRIYECIIIDSRNEDMVERIILYTEKIY